MGDYNQRNHANSHCRLTEMGLFTKIGNEELKVLPYGLKEKLEKI